MKNERISNRSLKLLKRVGSLMRKLWLPVELVRRNVLPEMLEMSHQSGSYNEGLHRHVGDQEGHNDQEQRSFLPTNG